METSQNQTSQNIGAKLTLLPEVFPVNPSQSQGSSLEQKTSAICGQKCLEQFGKFNRVGLWAKMLAGSLIGMEGWYSSRCILTWKMKGTKYNRLYFQLAPLMRRTEGTGFGLSLIKTPCAMDGQVTSGKKNPVSGNSGTLAQELMSEYAPTMMKLGMLPTPTAVQRDHPDRVLGLIQSGGATLYSRKNGEQRPNSILGAVMFYAMLPTSTTRDYKGSRTSETLKLAGRKKNNSLPDCFNQAGKTSQINPLFVEEMMGYPPNWTVLPFQNGEQKR